MTADDIRRLMRRNLDAATLKAAEREKRVARRTLALIVEHGVLPWATR
jgi:hypothetical protein